MNRIDVTVYLMKPIPLFALLGSVLGCVFAGALKGDAGYLAVVGAFFLLPFAAISGVLFGLLQCAFITLSKQKIIPLLVNGLLGTFACYLGVGLIELTFTKEIFSPSWSFSWLRVPSVASGFVCGCIYTAFTPKLSDENA